MEAISADRLRAAVAAVRSAEFGRQAEGVARPRSVLGVVRDRAPLRLMLRVAAAEGRLVWHGPDSFALLERPRAVRPPEPIGGGVLLRAIDRHWTMLLFAVPPALLLSIPALVVAISARAAVEMVVFPLLALVWVTVLLFTQLVQSSAWVRRTFGRRRAAPDELAAESSPGWNWSMTLFHHTAPAPGEELLRAAENRLAELVRQDTGRILERAGAEADDIRVREVLVVLVDGVTTGAMRELIRERLELPFGPGSRVALRRPADPVRGVRPPSQDRGGFLLIWFGGVAVVLGVLAWFVTGWESEDCPAAGCGDRPTGYVDALLWLVWRLMFQNAPGVEPGTLRTSVIGWLISVLGLTTILVVVAAVFSAVRYQRAAVRTVQERSEAMETRVLIMTVTPAERTAVFAALARTPESRYLGNVVVYDFGVIGAVRVGVVQCARQGAGAPGGAQATAAEAVRLWKPASVVMAGICCGLREDWTPPQQLGDIVVATSVFDLDRRTQHDDRSEPMGDRVSTSTFLISRFQDAHTGFDRVPVHFGQVLSASVLLDSRAHRDELKREHSRALAYEMEAHGLYAACADARVPWIMVKAISDWGVDRDEHYAADLAAANAAGFVRHTLARGGLS